jgi:hypothetical protein
LSFNNIMGSPHGAPPPDPVPEVPAAVPEVPAEPEPEEEDVPVARSAALIEESLNAKYSKVI